MPLPARTCRKIPSSELLADMAFPVAVDQIRDRSVGRFTLKNPNAVLLLEQSFGTQRAERDFVAFTFELKGVAGAKMKFLAQGLGNQHPPGLIESELGSHNGTIEWEHPLVNPF